MTDQGLRARALTHAIAPTLLWTFGLAACEAFVGEGPVPPYTEPNQLEPQAGTRAAAAGGAGGTGSVSQPAAGAGAGSTDPNTPNDPNMSPAPSACVSAPQKAQVVLTTYCSSCHSNAATAKGGFSTILEVPALLASGKVVKNQPDTSLIAKRMVANSMPPADVKKRPVADDVAAIQTWIMCGAEDWNTPIPQTAAFVSIDTRLRTVLDDLRSLPNPADRERQRYLDFSGLANAGLSADRVQVYREATSFMINSLSRGRTVVSPTAVDADKLIYRIDLRDYLWDNTTWTQLEALYPYAVNYDQDSRLFPFDEVSAEQIRQETGTRIPVIQADWFISHASRPPLYFTLLELPDSLQGLQQQLGVDIQRNIDTEQVQRAGFANAGPSQNNRVIERHELGGNRGALWLSYDFANNLELKNIFAHPLDFEEDGGEMIFNLDNGLQGYFIANAAGQRLDKAPNAVVQDPASRDGAVEAGLSCMNCHQKDGQLPKYDEIRDFQLNAGANAAEIEQVLALYVPATELQVSFDADQNRYRTARAALGINHVSDTTLHELDDTHQGIIDLDMVAAVVGLKSEDLQRSIDASPQAFPPEIVTLRTKGGGIQRDAFEAIVDELITALGLGQQLLVSGTSDDDDPEPTDTTTPPAAEPDAGVATDPNTDPDNNNNDGRGRR